jgi:hypothetical protein
MASAAASDGTMVPAGETQAPLRMGPCLATGMSEEAVFERLNSWGAAHDQELLDHRANLADIRSNLASTQATVSTAFDQAKGTVMSIVANFRSEAEALRQHGQYEASQSVARLELVISEARTRFDAQDLRFTENLAELMRRQQAVEAWASTEPARVAAIIQAAPIPPWVPRSPGGTPQLSFYPSPGLQAAAPFTPPQRSAVAPASAPAWGASPSPQAAASPTPAWDAWAAGRGAAPAPDAWAAGRAAPGPPGFDTGLLGGGGDTGGASFGGGGAGGGFGGAGMRGGAGAFDGGYSGGKGAPHQREMRIDGRSWGDSLKLDIGTSFEGFQVWKDRATMFLSRERPDVRRLLTWAESQSKEGLAAALLTQAGSLGIADLPSVEFALHDGIKLIIRDGLLGRARNCVELGCELWRSLCAEWSGAAPQLKHAKARRFQEPAKCKDTSELWAKLPAWERLGEDVKLAGLDIPEWLRSAALEKLLPAPLLATLVARPELSTYDARLAWVKTQMEHSRGLQQAAAYGPGVGKDASGDVYMNSVEAPAGHCEPCSEGLAWAFADAMAVGDWAQCSAINALKGGKGRKGLGKGGPGRGASSPGKGTADADATAEFNGVCNYCGIWGHRKSECRRYTADLAKKGGPKGGGKGDKGDGKGGKGGPKGGKGPPGIMECAAEEDWEENDDGCNDDLQAEEWFFNHTLSSVGAAPCTREWQHTKPARRAGGRWPQPGAPLPVHNRFAALNLLTDDAEEFLGAVTGETRGGKVVEAVVDSGAVHSVAPPGCFPGPVTSSPWSRAGRGYRAANGTGIKNLGQVQVPFGTSEGHRCQIPFQVAEVEQPLLSVAHLTAAGNLCELGHTDGRIVNLATGRSIALERRGGVYIMKMFLPDAAPQPFGWQGA